jgi:hypothetical protein
MLFFYFLILSLVFPCYLSPAASLDCRPKHNCIPCLQLLVELLGIEWRWFCLFAGKARWIERSYEIERKEESDWSGKNIMKATYWNPSLCIFLSKENRNWLFFLSHCWKQDISFYGNFESILFLFPFSILFYKISVALFTSTWRTWSVIVEYILY